MTMIRPGTLLPVTADDVERDQLAFGWFLVVGLDLNSMGQQLVGPAIQGALHVAVVARARVVVVGNHPRMDDMISCISPRHQQAGRTRPG